MLERIEKSSNDNPEEMVLSNDINNSFLEGLFRNFSHAPSQRACTVKFMITCKYLLIPL